MLYGVCYRPVLEPPSHAYGREKDRVAYCKWPIMTYLVACGRSIRPITLASIISIYRYDPLPDADKRLRSFLFFGMNDRYRLPLLVDGWVGRSL